MREQLLRPGSGLLAVWVTNKPALRAGLRRLLDEEWGCEEVAEWVWVKVTVAGEPVYALESAVRKPYEVLVIARRRREGEEGRGVKRKREEVENGGGVVVAREVTIPSKVVLAVPDVHSRKPCIKGLFPPSSAEGESRKLLLPVLQNSSNRTCRRRIAPARYSGAISRKGGIP